MNPVVFTSIVHSDEYKKAQFWSSGSQGNVAYQENKFKTTQQTGYNQCISTSWQKHKTQEVTHNRSNCVHHLLANHACQGSMHGTFAWVAGAVFFRRGFVFCFFLSKICCFQFFLIRLLRKRSNITLKLLRSWWGRCKKNSRRRKEGRVEEKSVCSAPAGPGARTRDLPHARRGSPAARQGDCLDKQAFPCL